MVNLGIVAHVDAGKTSLTEQLLHFAGVVDEVGSVDAGSTQTDTSDLERARGITIKSAVVSFVLGDTTVNLIDTPGHSDFIAEVERVLAVLDGAVLVVSAVEGVQAQTRVLMRALHRLAIPTLIFVNKIDRAGAQDEDLVAALADRLDVHPIVMGRPAGLGTAGASFTVFAPDDAEFVARLGDALSRHDDRLLEEIVLDDSEVGYARLHTSLATTTARALVNPVYFGSAITGVGVAEIADGIRTLLPDRPGDPEAPASGEIFKIERSPSGEKIAFVSMVAGTVRVRDRLPVGDGGESKVTAVSVFTRGRRDRRAILSAGEIGLLWGLDTARVGDLVGTPPPGERPGRQFAPPVLETVVVPTDESARGALHTALSQLAEQDPLIGMRSNDARREIQVSLYGEVQKEVIAATLSGEYGIEVTFRETTVLCVERPAGSGAAHELIGADDNPFLATVGLRVEPNEPGSGCCFGLEIELGSMPSAFFTAVWETVEETLEQGLYGWPVRDCVVIMTHSGYYARQSHSGATFDKSMSSTARDFRLLTPLVLMRALARAGTQLLEPLHRFHLELPPDTVAAVLPVLARLHGVPEVPEHTDSRTVVQGSIPAAHLYEFQQLLPGLTRGEATLEASFDRYEPARGAPPHRKRTDHNPLDRDAYLLRVKRRV